MAPNIVYKFYVLNDDTTKNEVTLIMDRNLGGEVAWINADDYGNSTVKNDKGPLTALKVLKERTSGWTNIPAYTYTLENDADGLGGSYTYNPITATTTAGTSEGVVENVRARLPRYGEIYAINNSKYLDPNTPWLYENLYNNGSLKPYGYWTSTAYSKNYEKAYIVGYGGGQGIAFDLQSYFVDNVGQYGLRPVITLSK